MRRQKQVYSRATEPTRDEMGESFRWGPIIKIGRLAMYNMLLKGVVDARSPSLGILKSVDPDQFEEMIKSPIPVFGYGESRRGDNK